MKPRDDLIASLVDDLAPVRPIGNINALAILWLLISALYVVAIIHVFGPVRPGALDQLIGNGRFLFENLLGLASIVLVAVGAFRAAVPDANARRVGLSGVMMMLGWIAMYAVGLLSPTFEPSMLGKREYCYIETLIYALPPMLVGGMMIRRLYPLQQVKVAWLVGLAAGMLPALYMQIACMYEPVHILKLHILPGLLAGVIGAGSVWLLARFRSKA
ncbi:MAG: NrsF family protein [Halioglobus sp.]